MELFDPHAYIQNCASKPFDKAPRITISQFQECCTHYQECAECAAAATKTAALVPEEHGPGPSKN